VAWLLVKSAWRHPIWRLNNDFFVEGLDVSALVVAVKAVEGRPGHPPADPRILLALWLYATADGVGSARELARLCDEHIAYQCACQWLWAVSV